MRISILTLFPDMFASYLDTPVVKRAVAKGKVQLEIIDIKEHAAGSFRKIDDSPCGGGRGMILRVDTVKAALDSVRKDGSHVVMFSPKGNTYNQTKAREFAAMDDIVLICGHYEGIDARVEDYVDEQISVGDYILTGGELPAMTVCDSIVRLLDDVLRDGSADDESFENNLLEYPQYTHPVEFDGKKVPEVLLGGNKALIDSWRLSRSIIETARRRPDLLARNTEGRSGADVLMYGNLVLKVQPVSDESKTEADALRWLQGKVPVPKIVERIESDGNDFLLMEKVKGKNLIHPDILANRNRLLKTCAAALKLLWKVDVSDYPIPAVPYAPKDDDDIQVFSHGDLCLPNIICDCHGITGLIDMGTAGIASRWRDIAMCAWSLSYNTNGELGADDLVAALGIPMDRERLGLWTEINGNT